MNNLTICIPTHCVKTEISGQYKGINQIVPSAPGTKLISTILEQLLSTTDLDQDVKIHIGFDKRKNREIDEQYEINLKQLSSVYSNLKVIVNESEIDDPITTAPQNFIKLIDSVKTKYYLFWEHDWIFLKHINFKNILEELDKNNKINWIKFSQFPNNNSIPGVHYIPEELKDKSPSSNIPLLPTTRWSNNPYICRTEVFQKWWKTFIYPTNDEGGFVEGPLNVFYNYYIEKLGKEKALDIFKCFIYGNWNDTPTVSHLNGYRVH
jgi:hypothetical protein